MNKTSPSISRRTSNILFWSGILISVIGVAGIVLAHNAWWTLGVLTGGLFMLPEYGEMLHQIDQEWIEKQKNNKDGDDDHYYGPWMG